MKCFRALYYEFFDFVKSVLAKSGIFDMRYISALDSSESETVRDPYVLRNW